MSIDLPISIDGILPAPLQPNTAAYLENRDRVHLLRRLPNGLWSVRVGGEIVTLSECLLRGEAQGG